jgi:membrane protein YdbS with pleckstrin-like domain
MLSKDQRLFMEYWEKNRLREKKTIKQLMVGLPIGLIFAIPVLILLFSGKFWYQRASMVANSQSSPVVLIIAIICIAAFVGIFYKRHQWDMREQHYLELKAREEDDAMKNEKQINEE